MSVGSRILHATVLMSGANVLARVGTFLANLAIFRLLGLELVGALGLIESWLTLAIMFSIFGLDAAVTRYVSNYLESDTNQIGQLAITALVLGGVLSLAVGMFIYFALRLPLVVEQVLGQAGQPESVLVLLNDHSFLLVCMVVVLTLKQIVLGLVYGLQDFQAFVWVNIVVGLISFPASYALVHWHGLVGALQVRLLLAATEGLLLLYGCHRQMRRLEVKVSLGRLRKNSERLVAFGLPTFVGQLVAQPAQPIMMSFLASQPGGITQVGVLATARRLSSLANFVPASMASTVMPILSTEWGRGDVPFFARGVVEALRMLWLTSMPAVLFFMAACPMLLAALYGSEFILAWGVTFVFLLIALLAGINESIDRALAAANRMWLSTANNLCWTILFFVLALLLIPSAGAMGYAVAFLLSFVLYVGLQLGWLRQLFQVRLGFLAPLIIFTMVMTAAAWVSARQSASVWQGVAATAISGITLLLEWRLFLDVGERQVLARSLRRISLRTFTSSRRTAHDDVVSDSTSDGFPGGAE